MVRVGWSDDYAEALKRQVGRATLRVAGKLVDWPTALGKDSDLVTINAKWGAFYGTDTELLRRRGYGTPSYCAGISAISASNHSA